MAAGPSIADIAAEAGVGTATVERVLNARGNVRAETAEKVVLAARRLGCDRRMPEAYRGIIRIEVIMVRPDSAFFKRLSGAFARISASLAQTIHIHRTFLDEHDPARLSQHILQPKTRRSGLIIVAPDDLRVRDSVRKLRATGLPVVSIVSRIGDASETFVGIDNYAAGRTAALFMTNFQRHRAGAILALCHSWVYEGHRERLRGFSDYLAENGAPDHRFPLIAFGRDEAHATQRALHEALATAPDCIGLYSAGGANRAIAEFLQHRRDRTQKIIWIAHELTENARGWLKSGLMQLALDQAPEAQARRAIDRILQLAGFIGGAIDTSPVPFATYTSENC